MSRPCSLARGPKPPVAPKPRLHNLEETNCPNANCSVTMCSNGELSYSEEEIDQDNEFADQLVTDKRYFLFTANHLTDPTGSCDNNNEAEQERLEGRDMELMDSAETDSTDSVDAIDISDADSDADSGDGVEISDIECEGNITPEDCAGEALADTDGLSECDVLSNNEGSSGSLCETAVESCLTEKDKNTTEEPVNNRGVAVDQLPSVEEESCFSVLCISTLRGGSDEELDTTGRECSTSDAEAEYVNSCISIPPSEEYPYDVIGSPCVSRVPKMAEDFFQPYSVIDTVPEAYTVTDFVGKFEQKNNLNWVNMSVGMAAAKSEPYYVSSNDVADIEDNQAHEEDLSHKSRDLPSSQMGPPEKHTISTNKEEVDDYADIDDSFCQDPNDSQHLEYASSEDYVEIGDDDDEETNQQQRHQKNKVVECESASKLDHTLLNQLNSNPHFRLCSITVPANLDLGRASEITNRLVVADTTEAFEEEIDFDGHIVPYYEDSDTEGDNISDEHVYEEAGLDSEGENFLSVERKCMVTRSRSLSCKMPGYVPETVPEETGSEYQTHDYCTVALDKSVDTPSDSEKPDAGKMFPSSNPRHFVLYPRSYSEGRDVPMSAYAEGSLAWEARMKRKDDNLSLPCVIASSGSFSHRGLHPSSGLSTPTSAVEIPPPFELAYITKKPITKSSPSLLIESDSPEKQKKKMSSFKRFLALKFKRKTESRSQVDVSTPSSRSSSESSHHGPLRALDIDRRSMSGSPQLQSRCGTPYQSSDVPPTFLLYKDGPRRKVDPKIFGNRSVLRVESFEDRSRPPLIPLPLTKPRSISFPSADTSDYENIPAMSSDYENIQIQPQRPAQAGTISDGSNQALSSANETDGYVDMSSFTGFESKPQTPDQKSESAYTEPYRACPAPPRSSSGPACQPAGEEDQGRTSEEEDGCTEYYHDKQIDGRSRAFYIAKGLMDSEKLHVKCLKMLHEDFRTAVRAAVEEQGDSVLEPGRLEQILSQLPEVYTLHCHILADLETRLRQWEESQKIADVILSQRIEFTIFNTYISEYDRSMALLDESCRNSPTFATIVKQFEEKPLGGNVSFKHQLLQVVVRVLQYRMLLTDYLNNLSPDSAEYEDTQAALVIVSDVSDQVNDNLKQGENLLRLVHIEYSIKSQRDVLQPGRVSFVPTDKGIVFPQIWNVEMVRPFPCNFSSSLESPHNILREGQN